MMNDPAEWFYKATLEELVDRVIWESLMEGTAHCGWTDRAREGLVKNCQSSVRWAIAQKIEMAQAKTKGVPMAKEQSMYKKEPKKKPAKKGGKKK